jgi:hypothetical protein
MPRHEDTSGAIAGFVQARLHGSAAVDQTFVRGWLKAVQRRNCQPTTLTTYCGALKASVHSWDGHRSTSLLQAQRVHIKRLIDALPP